MFHFFWVVFVLGLFFYLRSTEGVKKQKKRLFNQVWTQNGGLQETFLDSSDFDAQTEASEKTTKHLPSVCGFERKTLFFFHRRREAGMKVQAWKKRVFAWNFKVSRCRFLHQNATNLIKSTLVDEISKKSVS